MVLMQAVLCLGAQSIHAASTAGCTALPHADHPLARLHRGQMTAVVFLPDAANGYYRGARFDWSGIVGCVSLPGHTFFGEWFKTYVPTANDAVTGPAEEFRSLTDEPGYDDAGPNGLFLKIGVGVLRRIGDVPYRFGGDYPIVDHGDWTVKQGRHSLLFRQVLHTSFGYAYVYEKVLSLDAHGTVLTLTHRLRNTGVKTIDTAVYNHDFFQFDGRPIGPGVELRLPFVPVPDKPLPAAVRIDGTTIRIVSPLEPGQGLGAYVTGFSSVPSQFDFTVLDTTAGLGIRQTADAPLVRMYLWGTPSTLCPEGYIGVHVAPGQTQTWTLRYRFSTGGGKGRTHSMEAIAQ